MWLARRDRGWRTAPVLLGGVGLVLLVATVATAASSGWPGMPARRATTCAAPPLPGRVVDITVTDMMAGAASGPMMGGGMSGMMRVVITPTAIRARQVSLRVTNTGGLVHELLVLPLAPGGPVGARPVGADGTVSERASVGEVSRTCGTGVGDGLASGATGWTTLSLPPARYELICNLPGHYAMGMYAELDVR